LELPNLIKIKSIWEDEDTAWCRFSIDVNMRPFSQWQSQHPAEFSWSMVSALRYLASILVDVVADGVGDAAGGFVVIQSEGAELSEVEEIWRQLAGEAVVACWRGRAPSACGTATACLISLW
jgi:hypothetical protein